MRRRGVCRQGAARSGGGVCTFGFNLLQVNMLPEPYRPPEGSAA